MFSNLNQPVRLTEDKASISRFLYEALSHTDPHTFIILNFFCETPVFLSVSESLRRRAGSPRCVRFPKATHMLLKTPQRTEGGELPPPRLFIFFSFQKKQKQLCSPQHLQYLLDRVLTLQFSSTLPVVEVCRKITVWTVSALSPFNLSSSSNSSS